MADLEKRIDAVIRGTTHKAKKLGGAAAGQGGPLGLVRLRKESAQQLFAQGVPLVLAPSKVSTKHFFEGQRYAWRIDSARYLKRGVTLNVLVEEYLDRQGRLPYSSKVAFFVEKKYA